MEWGRILAYLDIGDKHARSSLAGHDVGMKVLATPEMKAKLKKLAVDPMPMTTAEMDKFVASELANNGKLIKASGISPK